MSKILISLPAQLVSRMRAAIPHRGRSEVVAHLIEQEIVKREKTLYECAAAVEKDPALRSEMKEFDVTLQDGLKNESGILILKTIEMPDMSEFQDLIGKSRQFAKSAGLTRKDLSLAIKSARQRK